MYKTNLELLVALLKVKKLHVSELKKKVEKLMDDESVGSIYSNMLSINQIEVKVLSTVIDSEEKRN